jgi:hypothetical protein
VPKGMYTPTPQKVKEFFKTIQSLGIPPKIDREYLKTIGFRSSNDTYLIGVAKFLGFVDTAGTPTAKWSDFKDRKKAPEVMADAIKTSYADLYSTFPDAEKKSDDTLHNYFAAKAGAADSVARLMVRTFQNLCELADFEPVSVEEHDITPTGAVERKAGELPPGVKPVTLNINIQLQLPATEDVTIYEALFSALKKNLFL